MIVGIVAGEGFVSKSVATGRMSVLSGMREWWPVHAAFTRQQEGKTIQMISYSSLYKSLRVAWAWMGMRSRNSVTPAAHQDVQNITGVLTMMLKQTTLIHPINTTFYRLQEAPLKGWIGISQIVV